MAEVVYDGDGLVELKDIDPSVRPIVDTAEALIGKKRSSHGEIIVTLFELCNLACKFCNQDHATDFGMNAIRDKLKDVIKAIELLQKMRKDHFSINLMGGELFMDSVGDETFEDYRGLVLDIHEYARQKGLEISYTFVTNLVHFNTARVKRLIDGLRENGVDVDLGTSYDPAARFNASNLIVFRRNAEIYMDYLSVVNVVMTAPSIRKFLSGNTPHFDFLYEHFDIYFDYYTLEDNWETMFPKDAEMRDLLVYLVEHYPNTHPVKTYRENETNSMNCQNTYTILPDGKAGRCTVFLNSWHKDRMPKTAGELEYDFLDARDCMSCEYFTRCGLGCYVQQNFNGPARSMNYCWMKDVHKKVDEVKGVR